ncbi:hypothetical protein JZ751_004893 [Albula glossodonta]|uniref:G-protein coupled receptors family 3 profile domain-containing protein n=1 Tax=Albula glossodonta TaxID=121402 RepID=A0A8T2P6P3_9TELE|nr:hypothetical protein JZ751_004893 [Albula glossodonta]
MESSLYQCILGVCLLLNLGGCCDISLSTCGGQAPGDVLIGVLNPCHAKVEALHKRIQPEAYNCTDFDLTPFTRTLAAAYTIEEINNSGFLPGVRLGYVICDTCSDATKAIHATENLLSINGSLPVQCDYIDYRPPVKVIIGSRYSEESIPVARLLGLHMVPQISCTASAPVLSDKLRFGSFLRMIPSDVHQTQALAKLMTRFSWDWIGVVSGDDDYGKAALQSFLLDADNAGVCVAFQEVLPHYLDHTHTNRRIQEVAGQIRSSKAQVVLLIVKGELVAELFQEMIRTNTTRTWIASDAWSISRQLASMEGINEVGDIFGFTFITGEIPGFKEYLLKLQPSPGAVNHYIQMYKELRFKCTPELLQYRECLKNNLTELCQMPDSIKYKSNRACHVPDPQKADDDFLVQNVDLTELYSEKVAVLTVAHALKQLLQCNETACPGEKNFQPWKLLEELKKVKFELDNRLIYFDESGNSVNGYDLIMWVKAGDKREFRVVGSYEVLKGIVEINEDKLQWMDNNNNTVPRSRCSELCGPGSRKDVSNISCCYNCTACEEGTYTDDWNQHDCEKCPNGTWSLKGWDHCEERTEKFQRWNEPYAIALVTAAVLGLLLLMAVLIIFLIHRKTPAVKIAGGKLCYVMIAGLSVSFASVVLFVGMPNDHLCRARQAMYGLGFTLCVSCILVRAFRTFLAFLFDLDRQHRLKKLYKPVAIVVISTGVQGLICVFWLIFDSPKVTYFLDGMDKWLQCTEGTSVGFGIMLSYIGLLAFICFLLAFKGRKVPQDFNETGNIIFGMLIYLFVWVCFIPIYVSREKLNERSVVQASAILASNYGIIFCHFVPKCYIALCRRKENVHEVFKKRLRKFTIDTSVNVFDITMRSGSPGGMSAAGSQSDNDSAFAEPQEPSVASVGAAANVFRHSERDATHLSLRKRRLRSHSF